MPIDMPNVEETNNQILDDIQQLQEVEQEMFSNLENNPNLTQQQQQAIIQNINQISSMRLNLYKTLTGVTDYFQSALYNSQGTLKEQATAIDIVEEELNRAKEKLKILEEEKNNKIRLIEINTYYGDKYQEHAALMKIIIITLVPIIILAILYNKGLLPNAVYYGLVIIIAAIGSYFMWYKLSSIWNRNNMDYQEYNWPVYNPSQSSSTTTTETSDPWENGLVVYNNSSAATGCSDQSCCASGTTYDTNINQCVVGTGSSSSSSASGSSSSASGSSSSASGSSSSASGSSSSASTPSSSMFSSLYSSAENAYNSLTNNLGGSESFVNFNEVYTNPVRYPKKPDTTFNKTYKPSVSKSFINYQ